MEPLLTVYSTPLFLKQADEHLSEEERMELTVYLAANPEDGDIIQGTGGIRKIRWAAEGTGKRGGYRVIYYYHSDDFPLAVLLLYRKNEKTDLTEKEKKMFKKLTDILLKEWKNEQIR